MKGNSPTPHSFRQRGLAPLTVILGILALGVIGLATGEVVMATDPTLPAVDPMTAQGQAALSARFGRKHTASAVIFPDQTLPLRFSHKVHLDLELACTECHGGVTDSLRAKDRNLPPEATCLDCHDAKAAAEGKTVDPPASCETCHPGYTPEWLPGADFSNTSAVKVHPPAVVIPEPHLKFNHKAHLQQGIGCERCHGSMKDVDLATRENSLPIMATCIDCHDGKQASSQCKTCHISEPDGRIDTDLPTGKLVPAGWYFMDAHDDDWLNSHRAVASLGEGNCETCHTQKECLDCHNGVKKPLKVHPNNWVLQHSNAGRKNDPDCTSCHRSQTFCVDCHQSTGVSNEVATRQGPRMKFHPDGWVEGDVDGDVKMKVRGPNHHGFQAERNIRACASCHLETTCISCHATLDVGGRFSKPPTPHPPGFVSSGDCVRVRNKNERVCYKCHTPVSQEMRCGE
jgi:hypothetical protein